MLDHVMPLRSAAGIDTASTLAMFQDIAERNSQSVTAKDDATGVFRECMEEVTHRAGGTRHEPQPIRTGGE